MTAHVGLKAYFPATVFALVLGASAPLGWADDDDEEEIPFDEAEIFFELNDTDGDLGIHGKIDGGPWTKITIEDPDERTIMKVKTKGSAREQGITELFFESAEPTFDELDPQDFFDRFPEGEYEVEGRGQEGEELESETELTHTMPAPPEPTVNGEMMAEQCDDEKDGYDASEVDAPVTIAWPAVTMSHPNADGAGAGVQPPIPVEIVNYELVIELEDEDGFTSVSSTILPPDVTSMTIPEEFTDLGDTFKYEVLAREESYNQTAVESCFVLDGDD